jgi:hypothetical protein
MNTRDQILLINLLIDHLKSEKKDAKSKHNDAYSKFYDAPWDTFRDKMDDMAWGVCNAFSGVIALRADIAKLLQIRRELQ